MEGAALTQHEPRRRGSRGITLIELLITLAIVSILAAIAYPSYEQYVQRSRRANTMAEMGNLAQRLEQSYSKNNAYDTSLDGSSVTNAYYTGSVDFTSGYKITATAKADTTQVDDTVDGTSCATLTLDHLGQRTPPACWPN